MRARFAPQQDRNIQGRAVALPMMLWRSLAKWTISVGMPSWFETTRLLANKVSLLIPLQGERKGI